jgi:hypothetical protein
MNKPQPDESLITNLDHEPISSLQPTSARLDDVIVSPEAFHRFPHLPAEIRVKIWYG